MTNNFYIDKILYTVDYLFGNNTNELFHDKEISYKLSNNTNKLRFIYVDDKLFATVKANGTYSLTLEAAKILLEHSNYMMNSVIIIDEIKEYIKEGKSVFNKHVIDAGKNIFPGSEAIIINKNKELIGIGKAITSFEIMKKSNIGVAIKVRHI